MWRHNLLCPPFAGGEDKERSGTGAALTPKRRALDMKRPSAEEGHWY
jgi:hypothetical protein